MPRSHNTSKYFQPTYTAQDEAFYELFGDKTESEEDEHDPSFTFDPVHYSPPKLDQEYYNRLLKAAEEDRKRIRANKQRIIDESRHLNILKDIYKDKLCIHDPIAHANITVEEATVLLTKIGKYAEVA